MPHAETLFSCGIVFEMSLKFLIAGFDGLRPDFATPENMPRLAGFLEKSHTWENYLACFPTETYVNHPSIFSGVRPERHGVIANSFCYEDEKRRMHLFEGFRIDSVMEADALMHGLYAVPDLGARLAREGKRLRIYCANSPGSTRLQHVHASDFKGHLNAPVHALDQTIPAREAHELIRTHGNGVPLEFPDALGTTLTVDLFFERELKNGPEGLAEATVLWIGEPDHSEHELGLFSDKTLEGLRQADREFGRVLDWWETQGRAKDIQLVVMSDHGHVEVARHADFEEILENAGLHVLTGSGIARGVEPRADDVILIGEYASGIWVPGKKRETLEAVRDALMRSPEVGMIFSQPDPDRPGAREGLIPGTFSEGLLSSAHPRGPDIRFIPRGDPKTGRCVMTNALALGSGAHGGLLPQETHALLAIQGSRFPGFGRHPEPATHEDFAATLMTMLGLLDDDAPLPLPTGRILSEALSEEASARRAPVPRETLTIARGDFSQTLHFLTLEGRSYVLSGGRTERLPL